MDPSMGGMFIWESGTHGIGIMIVNAGATLELKHKDTKIIDGSSLTNNGTINWSASDGTRINLVALMVNSSDAVMNITGDGEFDSTTFARGMFDNQGTAHKFNSFGTTRFDRNFFNNSGTVQVDSGMLDIGGGGTSSGASTMTATDELVQFGTNLPTQLYILGANTRFSGAGTARIIGVVQIASGATVHFDRLQMQSGSLNVLGATAQIPH